MKNTWFVPCLATHSFPSAHFDWNKRPSNLPIPLEIGGRGSSGENFGWGKFLHPRISVGTIAGTKADEQKNLMGYTLGRQNQSLGYTATRKFFWDMNSIKADHDTQYTGTISSPQKKHASCRPGVQEMARIAQKSFEGKLRHQSKISPVVLQF